MPLQPGNIDALLALMVVNGPIGTISWSRAELHSATVLIQELGFPVHYAFCTHPRPRSEHLDFHLDHFERQGLFKQIRDHQYPSDPGRDVFCTSVSSPFKLSTPFVTRVSLLRKENLEVIQCAATFAIHRRTGHDSSETTNLMKHEKQYSARHRAAAHDLFRRLGITQRKYSFLGIQDDALVPAY